jgi:hypothetical protein
MGLLHAIGEQSCPWRPSHVPVADRQRMCLMAQQREAWIAIQRIANFLVNLRSRPDYLTASVTSLLILPM